jgi:hypothetical protein
MARLEKEIDELAKRIAALPPRGRERLLELVLTADVLPAAPVWIQTLVTDLDGAVLAARTIESFADVLTVVETDPLANVGPGTVEWIEPYEVGETREHLYGLALPDTPGTYPTHTDVLVDDVVVASADLDVVLGRSACGLFADAVDGLQANDAAGCHDHGGVRPVLAHIDDVELCCGAADGDDCDEDECDDHDCDAHDCREDEDAHGGWGDDDECGEGDDHHDHDDDCEQNGDCGHDGWGDDDRGEDDGHGHHDDGDDGDHGDGGHGDDDDDDDCACTRDPEDALDQVLRATQKLRTVDCDGTVEARLDLDRLIRVLQVEGSR